MTMINFISIKEKDEGTLMLFSVKFIEITFNMSFVRNAAYKQAPFYTVLIYSIHCRSQ